MSRHTCSKIRPTATVFRKYTRALTFENICQLMHRCLDADADGFIGRQEWITGLNAVQAGGFAARAPPPPQGQADMDHAVRVPLGLDPSAQAHIAFETVRERLEAALQQKAVAESRVHTLGTLRRRIHTEMKTPTQHT